MLVRSFEDKVTELVSKLKKQKIFPDLQNDGDSGGGGDGIIDQRASLFDTDYDVEPLVANLRERLEMAAILDASEQSASARSVQLWRMLDEELESSRDHEMRTAMHTGRSNITKTMKCDANFAILQQARHIDSLEYC